MEHYSFTVNGFIIELYPTNKKREGDLTIGLELKIPIEEFTKIHNGLIQVYELETIVDNSQKRES